MKLKANELRIGNLVEINAPITNKIISIDVYHISELKKNKGYFKPIPLTEEWLLKFGFEWTDYDEENPYFLGLKCRNRDLFYTDRSCDFKYVSFNHSIIGVINIEYVHQLQNLYFALTNEELEIKM